jgi:hypothetical protein
MCRKSSSFENVDKQGHNVRDVQSVENLNDGTTAGSHIRVLRAMDRAASGSGNLNLGIPCAQVVKLMECTDSETYDTKMTRMYSLMCHRTGT